MKLACVRLTPFALPLRAPLQTAHGTIRARRGMLVALVSHDGATGYGEATPPFEACAASEGFALETAWLDLVARARGVSLARLLAGSAEPRRAVRVNALLAGREPAAAAEEASAAVAAGFRTLKLKVGAGPLAADRARLVAVRAAIGSAVALRIDANGAWTPEQALDALAALDDLGLELVEQPVAAHDVAGLARVRAAQRTPVAADESIDGEASAERVLDAHAADWLVLKPGAIGGLRASLGLAQRARAGGVGGFVTSGLDGAIARAAALALAAALPDPLPACGLATGALLAADLAPGGEPKDGELELSHSPGLGVVPDPHRLRELALGPTRELRLP